MPEPADPHPGGPCRLPAVRGPRWFDAEGRPIVVRVEIPLTSEEMVAALYGVVEGAEISGDEALIGCAAVTVILEGLPALAERAARIRRDDLLGTAESPEFLALCRRRVAALLAR